ncbi:hypothetical protein [Polyangium spumosum]|uniref:Uncharacterized protein n=1 Tax=Polyangium spumosum TaxID=889282 RepID=A0A6N7Q2N6_9BACT|nr:hypothetical protein [Polyangium spumosum]MRG96875.1 hypothetical protein [Polyangium spumosum]
MASSSLTPAAQARETTPIAARAWFPRVRVCIDCRTLLGPKETCDGGRKHRVASLETRAGRDALRTEVWGPPSVRRRAKQLAKAGGTSLGAGSIFEGCTGCGDCGSVALDAEFLPVVAVVALIAAAGVLLYWIIAKIYEAIRAYQNRPRPNGGITKPPSLGRRPGPRGTVLGQTGMLAPATGKPCVAWALDLRNKRFLGTDLMLHDAETSGFSVKLDDGTILRVPGGRVRLEGPKERLDRADAPPVDGFVQTINQNDDPEDEGLEPFPYDTVDEIVVRPGDRVRVFGELERDVDPAAPGGYRAANVILVPKGVPALRVEQQQ